jgi:hypothetical protein
LLILSHDKIIEVGVVGEMLESIDIEMNINFA